MNIQLQHKFTFLSILFLSLLSIHAVAEKESKLESLKKKLHQEQSESKRAKTLRNIAQAYLDEDLDSAESYALKTVELYESLKDTAELGAVYNQSGLVYYYKGDYDNALIHWTKCMKYHELTGNKRELSRINTNIGAVYYNQSDHVKALEYYLKAQAFAEEINDSLRLMTVYANIGAIYGLKEKTYQKAIDYDLKALELGEHLNDKNTIGTISGNIAELYKNLHNHERAQFYFEKSLEAHKGTANEAYALIGMAKVYEIAGDYLKALDLYKDAYQIAYDFGMKLDQSDALDGLGRLQIKMGNNAEGIRNLEKAYEVGQEINYRENMLDAALKLSKELTKAGIHEKANKYSRIALALKDSLYNVEFDQKVSDQISNYKLQKKEDEITMLNQEKQLQTLEYEAEVAKKNRTRNAFAIGGLALLLFAVGLWSRLRYVRNSRTIIQKEKERSEELLLNILPEEIAEELKEKGKADARNYDLASILFTDFKEFTQVSEKLSADELVNEINSCFKAFDEIIDKYGIEKIKTIGDAYMAAGGLPVPDENSVKNTVLAALEMQSFIIRRKAEKTAENHIAFDMRVGIHTGPVVAGIVGVKKFQYDVWGDTVNTASRMESNSEISKVNISQSTYDLLKDDPNFSFEHRGKLNVKGKGEMNMYFVNLN